MKGEVEKINSNFYHNFKKIIIKNEREKVSRKKKT
jgi:hypothetical protein